MYREHEYYLKRCIEVSKASREHGNTPFGAILVDEDGNILLEQENVDIIAHKSTGHAETQLAEKASTMYSKDFLWKCTLYTTAEPCAMCAGCIYWSNIGRVVYAMTEKDLLSLTGSDEQNPTFDLPCREVFAKGQKDIQVIGPFLHRLQLKFTGDSGTNNLWDQGLQKLFYFFRGYLLWGTQTILTNRIQSSHFVPFLRMSEKAISV